MANDLLIGLFARSFALWIVLASAPATAEKPDRYLMLTHPAVTWMLRAELPGALEEYNQYRDGVGSYARGQARDGRQRYSMVIDRYPDASDAKSCRDGELAHIRKNPLVAQLTVETSEKADAAYLRTNGTVTFDKRTAYTQHVHRYLFRDGLCVKMHVSSPVEGVEMAAALTAAVDSMVTTDLPASIVRLFYLAPKLALKLRSPPAWGFETSDPTAGPLREINWRTPDGHFQLMLNFFARQPGQSESADDLVRKTVESARMRLAAEAVQTAIDIQSLKGRDIEGLFIFVSDKKLVGKADKPGDWKHLRQGMLKMGTSNEVMVIFSVFSNSEQSADVSAAMQLLENLEIVAN